MKDAARFVIQRHTRESRGVHWDLMLEAGPVLETYRLELPPEELRAAGKTAAVRIFDHPPTFLNYEGSVNEGRGSVEIADAGAYRLLDACEKRREMLLEGKVVTGRFALSQIAGDNWELSLLSS